MDGRLFYFVLNMSLIGGLITVLLLLVRSVLIRVTGRSMAYGIWMIVFIRLFIPIGISTPFSFFNILNSDFIRPIPVSSSEGVSMSISAMNTIQGVTDYTLMSYKTPFYQSFFRIGSWVWLGASSIALVILAVSYGVTYWRLNQLPKHKVIIEVGNQKIKAFESKSIISPFVSGIVRMQIYLPKDLSDESKKLLVLHEAIHKKRFDNLLKFLGLLALCFHFWNPLVWVAYEIFLKDMEKSCDLKVLKQCDTKARLKYGNLLIDYAQKQSLGVVAFGHTSIQQRIHQIATYKPLSQKVLWGLSLLYVALVVLFISNRM